MARGWRFVAPPAGLFFRWLYRERNSHRAIDPEITKINSRVHRVTVSMKSRRTAEKSEWGADFEKQLLAEMRTRRARVAKLIRAVEVELQRRGLSILDQPVTSQTSKPRPARKRS
jgi:hypothetical protein